MSLDLDDEIQALPQDKRHALMKDALLVTIHSNAIKLTLSISWSKLLVLRK